MRTKEKKEPAPEPEVPTFRSLGLNAEIVRGAAYALGLNPEVSPEIVDLITPAPVQTQAIPSILKGNNVAIASETGSGKSLAFLLPLVQRVRILSELRSMNYGLDWKYGEPLALVLCATRELAIQTHSVLRLIAKAAHLDTCVVHGGEGNFIGQKKSMQRVLDIVVGTPDRLMKMRTNGQVRFKHVRWVAIDEADFLLTQNFKDLYWILEKMDSESRVGADRIRYTLSMASVTKPVLRLLSDDPRWKEVRLLRSRSLHKPSVNCMHSFQKTKGRDKVILLTSMLHSEILGKVERRPTLVFCNSVTSAQSIYYQLTQSFANNQRDGGLGRMIGRLHKEMPPAEREEAVRKFAKGDFQVLVCTDIAQRGLDLPNCSHVINFDFPLNALDYLHRAGRTARFGEAGRVTSLITKGDHYLSRAIERSVQLRKPINELSSDRRDYMVGGALHDLMEHQTKKALKGKSAVKPYHGSVR